MKIAAILAYLDQEQISYIFSGNQDIEVDGFSSLTRYQQGTFTWIKKQENIPKSVNLSALSLVFTAPDVDTGSVGNVIRTSESKRAFFGTIERFYHEQDDRPPVGQFTYIGPKVKLGEGVRIGHNCTLDGEITIGDGTVIWNHVTIINKVKIGKNCVIQSGTVIGHDGFGYTEAPNHCKTMVKHFGGVTIGDDVLVSSNVCICRGTIDDTIIECGVKIDNMSHIAHNCILKEHTALAYPCHLGGSSTYGSNSYLAGAIVRNQCSIGKNAFVGLGSVVVKDVAPDQIVAGSPARQFIKKGAQSVKSKTIFELTVGESAEQQSIVTLENAHKYAEITSDNNPIHFDTESARCSRFKRPIAHGMILGGFISGVIGSQLPGFGCLYEEQSLQFKRPVFYGDVIHTKVTVEELNIEMNRVVLFTECINQNQEVVLTGKAVVLPRKG